MKYFLFMFALFSYPAFAQTPIPAPGAIFTCTVQDYTGAPDMYTCHKGWLLNKLSAEQSDCHSTEDTGSWTNAPPPNQSSFDLNVTWKLDTACVSQPFSGKDVIGYTGGPLVCPPGSSQQSVTNGIPICYCPKGSGYNCTPSNSFKNIQPNH
jgi:hypothetical protein